MAEAIIEITDLTKYYSQKCAVDHLNVTIQRGEVFGLLGPNGAGKSTTILMLLGLSEPSAGQAIVCGYHSTRQPIEVKRKVGYLPDNIGFYEERTGLENIVYTALINGVPKQEATERAERLLKQVGLEQAKNKKAGHYSRGMRQRLGLADVLIKEPEVIILDEPTLGIDPQGVQELLQIIRYLSKEKGITVLLSSHQLHQVQQICDRVGLFVDGRLLAEGDVQTLARKLFPAYKLTYYATVSNQPPDLVERLQKINGVFSVEKGESGQQLIMKTEVDLSARLAGFIVQSGAALHEFGLKEYGLDDIYHHYFEGGVSDEVSEV
ncbi:ABC transporter ATP-binding protein [Alkalihalobacillus oceani]|uniref:ABC transporter ATP-binding protein n=1 Tax=Halalkalibacter oceani TaxID=1653776 RepID=UPI00203A41F6|nr:ABC transporter ATP-binding protein [Halalkalibacter oceani]MCM3761184.1 ABC transporter ATP-binding protein [Halalkalibacter oceani]